MSTLEIILSFLSPIALAIGTWWGSRKKDNAQATQSEMENVEKALGIYRGIISDLSNEIKSLKEQLSKFQDELNEAKQLISTLKNS